MPYQCGNSAQHHFDPNSGEDHPLPLRPLGEQQNIGGVRVKGRSEVNQEKTHLMHVAAEMLTSQTMSEFVDAPQYQQQNPEDPYVVRAFICEVVKLAGVLLHPRPVPC